MELNFDHTKYTPLCQIMGEMGSDKGNVNISKSWHNYTTFYFNIFKDRRYESLRIFELGIGTNDISVPSNMGLHGRPGASLYGWEKFFTNSKIFGADIDKKILFNTGRIKTFYCDQRDPDVIKNMWNSDELKENFDIMIEDGLHEFNANVCFFENSIHKLNKDGYYIIEDILEHEIPFFLKKMEEWRIKYKHLNFDFLKLPSLSNIFDNNLLVVKNI